MKSRFKAKVLVVLAVSLLSSSLLITPFAGAESIVDRTRPDAPTLALRGKYDTGVKTFNLVHEDQPNIVKAKEGEDIPTYDRPITVEVWYPAQTDTNAKTAVYDAMTPDGGGAKLHGEAVRNAEPVRDQAEFPLIVLSHGYVGDRYLMSHLGEHLASWGYVVVSIEHPDSTFNNQAAFASTLYNRSLDQIFVLDEMEKLAMEGSNSIFEGVINVENSAIVGFSMGGYGALNVIGAGYTERSVNYGWSPPNGVLEKRQHGNIEPDERVKAMVGLAPWGMQQGFWSPKTLQSVTAPVFLIAGTNDNVAGYEKGTKRIFEELKNADRYLLTLLEARHNVGTIPAPEEVVDLWQESPEFIDYSNWMYYEDPVWDKDRMNDIVQHFTLAFLNKELKGNESAEKYLDVEVEKLNNAVFSLNDNGNPTDEHTVWPGFKRFNRFGLILEHETPKS